MRVTYLRTSLPRPPAVNRALGQRIRCEASLLTDKGMRLLGFEREGLQLTIPFIDIRRK
jgi:hypothetical protein